MEEVKKQGMESLFCPYEVALKLKALGFDDPCFGYYEHGVFIFWYDSRQDYELLLNCSSPTFSQAFDFIRKKYYLYGIVIPTITMNWTFKTMIVVEEEVEVPPYKNVNAEDYSSHEQAELALLKELIKLVKEKSLI